jgi:hypothetical protein
MNQRKKIGRYLADVPRHGVVGKANDATVYFADRYGTLAYVLLAAWGVWALVYASDPAIGHEDTLALGCATVICCVPAPIVWLLSLIDAFRNRTGSLWKAVAQPKVLLTPILLAAILFGCAKRYPLFVRFTLSRPALESYAEEVRRLGEVPTFELPNEPEWIGLYSIGYAELVDNGCVRFMVDWSSEGQGGFAYSPEGDPPLVVVSQDSYSHLSGDWWLWTNDM